MRKSEFNEICRHHPLMEKIIHAWYSNSLDIYSDDGSVALTHPQTLLNEYLINGTLDITASGRFNTESLIEAFNTIKAHLLNNPEVVKYLLSIKLGTRQ